MPQPLQSLLAVSCPETRQQIVDLKQLRQTSAVRRPILRCYQAGLRAVRYIPEANGEAIQSDDEDIDDSDDSSDWENVDESEESPESVLSFAFSKKKDDRRGGQILRHENFFRLVDLKAVPQVSLLTRRLRESELESSAHDEGDSLRKRVNKDFQHDCAIPSAPKTLQTMVARELTPPLRSYLVREREDKLRTANSVHNRAQNSPATQQEATSPERSEEKLWDFRFHPYHSTGW